MTRAIFETNRRRGLQRVYNEANGIDPQTIRKAVTDILAYLRPASERAPVPGEGQRSRSRDDQRRVVPESLGDLPADQIARLITTLEAEMHEASADLRFEYAARLRDEIKDLKRELREVG
jgi:excinuclease ABC subunit B